MIKSAIRQFVLSHFLTRELFFVFGRRKTNLHKVDKALLNGNIQIAKESADNVIVSLTSYGNRVPELKYTLFSLVTQSIRPQRIVVNIAFEDETYLTDDIRSFEKYNVEFYKCKDIRSYKKLLPTLSRFPDACIVTVDDDVFYEKDWLKRLYEEHKRHPKDVCCHLIETITHDNGLIDPYRKWIPHYKYQSKVASKKHLLLGAWGVLYPPNTFFKDVQKEELFMNLSPMADDIWFYFMAVLNGTKIRQVKNPMTRLRYVNPYREYGIDCGTTLTQQNVIEGKNDVQIKNILSYYGMSEEEFIEYIEK